MTNKPKKTTSAATSPRPDSGRRKPSSSESGAATAAKPKSPARPKSAARIIPNKDGSGKRKAATGLKPKSTNRPKSTARGIPRKEGSGKGKPAAEVKSKSGSRATLQRTSAKAGSSWEPQIVVFACNWCSYAGADTAGVSRIQHQPNFRMIRVMCSGRIQPAFVLRAFEKGADGVLISGCHIGDCHYIFGNERALEQFDKTVNMVKLLGIESGRLRLEWISAAEGGRFAGVIDEFTDQVRALGPSPFSRKKSNNKEEVA